MAGNVDVEEKACAEIRISWRQQMFLPVNSFGIGFFHFFLQLYHLNRGNLQAPVPSPARHPSIDFKSPLETK